jgi:hypothetical protein
MSGGLDTKLDGRTSHQSVLPEFVMGRGHKPRWQNRCVSAVWTSLALKPLRVIRQLSLDFPVLNHSHSITVNSTGNLDCNAFAASVVDATLSGKHTVSCTSKMGNVTMDHTESTGSVVGFMGRGYFLALTALVAYLFAL